MGNVKIRLSKDRIPALREHPNNHTNEVTKIITIDGKVPYLNRHFK